MANTGGNWLEGECGGCHLCACREMVLLGRAQTPMDSAEGSRSTRKRGCWQKEGLDGGLCIKL